MVEKKRKVVSTNLGLLLICLFCSIFTLIDFIVIDKALDKYVKCEKCTKSNVVDTGNKDNTPVIDDDKKVLSEEDALNIGSLLFDKASLFYSETVLVTSSFCGQTVNDNNIELENRMYNMSRYYSSVQEVKDYLSGFLSQSMVNSKVTDSSFREIDGKLYCLSSSGKGFLTNYTGNKNIKVVDIQENKVIYSIEYVYVDFNSDNSSCKFDWNIRKEASDLSLCSSDELFNVNVDFVIEKNGNGKWIVTKFADHTSIDALNKDSINIRYYE